MGLPGEGKRIRVTRTPQREPVTMPEPEPVRETEPVEPREPVRV